MSLSQHSSSLSKGNHENHTIIEWKWSNGDKYEKSSRYSKTEKMVDTDGLSNDSYNGTQISNQAFQQSFLSENDIWSIEENILLGISNQPFNQQSINKREDTYNKLSEREMMCQTGQNPFMLENNYLKDLLVQDNFLKPKSTSEGREKGNVLE
jgi:hypothetical protein